VGDTTYNIQTVLGSDPFLPSQGQKTPEIGQFCLEAKEYMSPRK